MAASSTARAVFLSRLASELELHRVVSLKPPPPSSHLFSQHPVLRPLLVAAPGRPHRRTHSPPLFHCLFSSSGGESVADDYVSTRKLAFRREFSVLANFLKQINPLDTSVIAKGVSGAAKDSMKRTISAMLGLLPSDHFAVSIRASKDPLHRLLTSSIITGYTLWNAEYRVSLMRNFDKSPGSEDLTSASYSERLASRNESGEDREGCDRDTCETWGKVECRNPRFLEDLSPEALSYIQQLKSELASVEKRLNAQKQENMDLECGRGENNDLLNYLRSLEPEMVTELARPSSSEVEEIIQQLVQNVIQKYFGDDRSFGFLEDSVIEKSESCSDGDDIDNCAAIKTSRDYLAKLLFWCMLLGHHMRSLEYRLHLSCVGEEEKGKEKNEKITSQKRRIPGLVRAFLIPLSRSTRSSVPFSSSNLPVHLVPSMAEALQDTTKHQMEVTLKSIPSESVSFGRFSGDSSLSWDKWSAFSQNKYMEEVEKCSTPGSVKEKKAYFEAHYKKVAAHTMELLGQDKLTDHVAQSKSEEQIFQQSGGSCEVSDSTTNVDLEQLTHSSSDSIDAHETSHFGGDSKEEQFIKPDHSEAELLEEKMDTTEPKLEAPESNKNEGINELENLETEVNEAEIKEPKLDFIGDKTEVSANKIEVLELEEVGTDADASASKKNELGSYPEILTLQMHETCGKAETSEVEVDEMASKSSEETANEANSLADVPQPKLNGVGSEITKAMADEMGIQPDCSVSDVDIVVQDLENFKEAQEADKMSKKLAVKSNKSPVPKLDLDQGRQSPIIKLSKKKASTSTKQTDSDATKKRQTVPPASPKPKLSNHSTPKASKVTPTTPRTPASKVSLRKDPSALRSEYKRGSPTSLESSKLRSVSVDLASPPTNRGDLIMEKMGDKEIVQKAFKTFRNSLNLLRSSYDDEKPSAHQQPVMKGKQLPESPEKTQLVKQQPGPRTPNMTRSLNDSSGTKRMSKAASAPLVLRSDEGAKKQKDLLSALKKKPNSKESARTNLQTRSKEDNLEKVGKLQKASKYRVTPMPALDRQQGISGNHLNKRVST
ncbi:hypothetical protein H6P81_001251 [Aristolochia fimbriata]|uniref:Uncharacterized protein n=1 Tax=Aristolochia fimbriata TaxID=158543 RepID=A0AAV7F6N7_ARIFI|nr:hypothetical protein H6P81_001251 [Aristolochia fimbriata]